MRLTDKFTIQFLAFINFSHGRVHFVQAARFHCRSMDAHNMTGFTKAIRFSLCISLQSDRRQTFSAILRFTSYLLLWVVNFKAVVRSCLSCCKRPSFRPAALGHPTACICFDVCCLVVWFPKSPTQLSVTFHDIPWHSHILVAQHVKCHLVCIWQTPPASPAPSFGDQPAAWLAHPPSLTGDGPFPLGKWWFFKRSDDGKRRMTAYDSIAHQRHKEFYGILLDLHEAFCFGAIMYFRFVCFSMLFMRFADPVQGVAAVWRCAKLRTKWWFFLQLSAMLSSIDYWPVAIVCRDVWYEMSEHLLEVKHRSSRPVFISLRMHYPCSGFSIFLDSWTSTLVKQSRFHDMTDESRFITLKRPVLSPGFQA